MLHFHMPKPYHYYLICSTRYLSISAHLLTSSFITLSIRDTPTKLLKHFISRTFAFLLSAFLILHASAPYNAVGTITPSYRHFLVFILNPLLLRALFSAPHAQYSTLNNRSQQVMMDGCRSKLVNVVSGVPQGSVSGPLLFLLYT